MEIGWSEGTQKASNGKGKEKIVWICGNEI
jgi:hypothetical protein